MPVPEHYQDFKSGFGGWSPEESGDQEIVEIKPAPGLPPLRCVAGGYPAGTHYARCRRHDVNLALGDDFWFYGDFWLPPGYWDAQDSYHRYLWIGNYDLEQQQERRLGLYVYKSDKKLRIMRQRQGTEEVAIWTSPTARALPEGKVFQLAFHAKLSQTDGQALSELYIAGQKVASVTTRNVTPGTLAGSGGAVRFTRVGFGIDGAADQDTKKLELRVGPVGISAVGPVGISAKSPFGAPPPPPPPDSDPTPDCKECEDKLAAANKALAEANQKIAAAKEALA